MVICGREVSIRMVDNPGRSQLVPAMMVVVLIDLTNEVCNRASCACCEAVVVVEVMIFCSSLSSKRLKV